MLCRRHADGGQAGVAGYYVRIAPPHKDGGLTGRIVLRNRNGETIEASCLVAMDFSWLVRLGLRKATDRRVADTIKVVDQVLKVETPSGAVYRRYNDDGYGEYDDGRPYDGAGVGRAWPLLAGERGHLALQAGEDPIAYLDTMHRCASPGGLLPEQVWDAAPIPERFLFPGRPSGSAMPLLWSHAEFLKLLVARHEKRPVELLEAVRKRYGRPRAQGEEHALAQRDAGRPCRGGADAADRGPPPLHPAFRLRWLAGHRRASGGAAALRPVGRRHRPELCTGRAQLNFTRRYGASWEGQDHAVAIVARPEPQTLVHRHAGGGVELTRRCAAPGNLLRPHPVPLPTGESGRRGRINADLMSAVPKVSWLMTERCRMVALPLGALARDGLAGSRRGCRSLQVRYACADGKDHRRHLLCRTRSISSLSRRRSSLSPAADHLRLGHALRQCRQSRLSFVEQGQRCLRHREAIADTPTYADLRRRKTELNAPLRREGTARTCPSR